MNNEIINKKSEDYKTFIGLNKNLIKKIAKSQDEIILLCDLDINRATFSNYINGVSVPPIDILLKLCAHIGCSVDDLIIPSLGKRGNTLYSSIRKVSYLNQDGSYGPIEAKVHGYKVFKEFDTRKVLNPNENDYCHYNVFYMNYDSYLLGIQKGTYLLTDYEDEAFMFIKDKPQMYVLIKEGKVLYPSLIKKCKDDMKVSNIRADIYSYTNINGETVIETINMLMPKIHSKIVKAIKEF